MSFLHKILGKDGASQMAVDPGAHAAGRVTLRPSYLGTRGAYSLGAVSGTMAAGLGVNSEIFQFRWIHATRLCLVRRVSVSGGGIVAFAAGFGKFELMLARAWTADGTGGTPVAFSTAETNKKRFDFPLASLSDTGVRVASTAALGAGTKTPQTNPLAIQTFGVTATAGATLGNPGTDLWQRDTADEYPIVLEQDQGLVIRTTVPATGTWTFGVQVEWAEIDPADAGTDWA